MKLIDTTTYALCDFVESKTPPYAILSHTWGDEEVTFQEMSLPLRASRKGYEKIKQACSLAKRDGFAFIWVDTCCIDKSSSSELSESINSMFEWYAKADVCYVFIEDLHPDTPANKGLTKCRWFSRGWTLQELLAPRKVQFYDRDWSYRGTKHEFASIISDFTGIHVDILQGATSMSHSSIAARMSWAAHRQTTRTEDMAYCLLGVFNINMALLYGEGNKAFRRLQEEIIRHSNDLTIFAWDTPEDIQTSFLTLLAPSPAVFAKSRHTIPIQENHANFSVTNKGLLLTGNIPLRTAPIDAAETLYVLHLGAFQPESRFKPRDGGIYLRKIGPGLFFRVGHLGLSGFQNRFPKAGRFDIADKYIVIDPTTSNMQSMATFRKHALHVPRHPIFKLKKSFPGFLWDHTDKIFLKPNSDTFGKYSMVIGMLFEGILAGISVSIVILCDYRRVVPVFSVFERNQYPREAAFIFQEKYSADTISWEDLNLHTPRISALSNSVDLGVGLDVFHISVSSGVQIIDTTSGSYKVVSLNINITE